MRCQKKHGFPRWKRCMSFAIILLSLLCQSERVQAKVPYDTYNYDYWGEDVLQSSAFLYEKCYGTGNSELKLSNPQDLFVRGDKLYVADTGNARIVVLNQDGSIDAVIDHASSKEDSFSSPKGVFVTDEGNVYVADSGNGRIVEFDENYQYIREIGRPVTELISKSQEYTPTKVVVDYAGRIYVIAYGINMGLVEFDKNGEFQGFMGAAKVSVNGFTYFWKRYFATDAQKARTETIIPTEYSNIFVDQDSFIYATISNLEAEDYLAGADAIRRLNPTGTDVLRRLGNYDIIGDLYASSDDADWSVFTDVTATKSGCYYVLDSAGGKVFAYDHDGNNLFVFGTKGYRSGAMLNPSSIALSSDESTIYVLDSQIQGIMVYTITEYGHHLLSAIEKNSTGDETGAYAEWQQVLKYNANSELAYIGIGKKYLKAGDYEQAMEYFKNGNSKKYYSLAFKYHRKDVMQNQFGQMMLILGIVVAVILLIRSIFKFKRWVGEVRCSMSKH